MKISLLFALLLFFSCKTNKKLGSIPVPDRSSEPIVLNLDYEGEMLPAMQLDKLAEAQLKTVDPALVFIIDPPLLNLDYKGEEIPAMHLEKLPLKGLETIYIPKPGEPASLYKIMPYDGEEIPAIHIENSTLHKIRGTKGSVTVPNKVLDK